MTEISQTVSEPPRPRRRARPSFSLGAIRWVGAALSVVSPATAVALLERVFTTPRRHRLPERERVWLEQAASTRIRLEGGSTIPVYSWYPDEAQRGRGLMAAPDVPTILLVHGMSGRGTQMGAFVGPLTKRGFRVVSFDAPAHGFAEGKRLSLPELVDVVTEVARRVGPVSGLVAHSNGAAAVVAALSRGMDAKHVALISPPENLNRYLNRLARGLGFSQRVARMAQKRLERRHGVTFDALRGSALARNLRNGVLIVHDRNDRMVPFEEGEALAQNWHGAELLPVNSLGHSRILQDAVVLSTVAQFLKDGHEMT
jgi:pimeloyl-ACP methyl ester carboxylesterase